MDSDSIVLPPKRASGKRPKKRKFTGNIHTRKQQSGLDDSCASSSAKKINASLDLPEISPNFDGYRLIDVKALISFIEYHLSCKVCGSDITMSEQILNGLSSNFTLMCKTCSRGYCFQNSKKIGPKNNCAEVNLRSVYAMRTIGLGHAALRMFCGVMDLPRPISKKTYNSYVKKMVASTEKISEKSKHDAALEEVTLSNSSEVVVSGDGTWKTRGHTSRVGVCTLIGDRTKKVIDTEVLSSFCKACDTWRPLRGTPAYDDWFSKHKDSDCVLNHSGSAGKMELVGMTRMFQRSETKYDVKYVSYIGDGDARTYSAVVSAQPYGKDQTVSKIECVGHIQKRMGTRLRKLKQAKTKEGKSIGGKGRLTDPKIDLLTVYYGNAIRANKDCLDDMRKAIWAIYFHTRSTDAEPLHTFCPAGSDSWCKYQIASSNGTLQDFKHKPTIPLPVMDMIRPIFNDLSMPSLLRRCLGGKTQNPNESLNSVIWKLCPKTIGSGRRIAEIATNEATILFNDGNKGRLKVMEDLGLSTSSFVCDCMQKFDKHRIETAELRLQQNTKEMRKKKRNSEKAIAEKLVLKEGVTYSAGEF